MKFADSVELRGACGVIAKVHAAFARKLILANRGRPIREDKRVIAVQLPSVSAGERDLAFHGGNSNRQHRTEVCDGGQEVVIETDSTLPRIALTKSCRVIALKASSGVLGEVLTAERVEWLGARA
jgi:hypothetical protein